VGKTTIARIVAKTANCTNLKKGEVCEACPACLAIAAGNFLDLVEIDAASNTGVENVRELIEHVKFKPSSGRVKVFIIDEVHMLSKSAFNALLKTLEEPPAHVMFILATTEASKVPATIISRTQRFDFSRITPADIMAQLEKVAALEKLEVSKEALQLVARHSDGSMRDALSLLDKIVSLGETLSLPETEKLLGVTTTKSSVELMNMLADREPTKLPAFFEGLLFAGVDFSLFNKDFLEYCRKLLVLKVVGSVASLGLEKNEEKNIMAQADKFSAPEVIYLTRLFLRSYKDLAFSSSPELPMLLAALEGCLKLQGSAGYNPENLAKTAHAEQYKPKAQEKTSSQKSVEVASVERLPNYDTVELSEVEQFWPKVLEQIKLQNNPLATLLRNSPLEGVIDNAIVLGVKFLFHKEHLESTKNYVLLIETIQKVSGKNAAVKFILSKKPEMIDGSPALDALGDALRVFGGELVE